MHFGKADMGPGRPTLWRRFPQSWGRGSKNSLLPNAFVGASGSKRPLPQRAVGKLAPLDASEARSASCCSSASATRARGSGWPARQRVWSKGLTPDVFWFGGGGFFFLSQPPEKWHHKVVPAGLQDGRWCHPPGSSAVSRPELPTRVQRKLNGFHFRPSFVVVVRFFFGKPSPCVNSLRTFKPPVSASYFNPLLVVATLLHMESTQTEFRFFFYQGH